MVGTSSKILKRHKWHELLPASPNDFTLGPGSPVPLEAIIEDPGISLYCLDAARQRALFVKVPEIEQTTPFPFLYQRQFAYARSVISVSFDVLLSLSESSRLRDEDLVIIYSVGRCGSTLLSRAFDAASTVCGLSEPDVFGQLVEWRSTGIFADHRLSELTKACIRVLCKTTTERPTCRKWAIKPRAQSIELADFVLKSFPGARQIYLTREPLDWLGSVYRAFVHREHAEDRDYKRFVENAVARMCPLVRRLPAQAEPLPVWKTWSLLWLYSTQRYLELLDAGFTLLPIDFADLKQFPEETVRRILRYCDVELDQQEILSERLTRDSQDGSALARSKLGNALLPPHVKRETTAFFEDYAEHLERLRITVEDARARAPATTGYALP